jgi:NAD(P)-dependent dehydrogenase (short-subunit alcohol dehydrogenase family)
VVIGYAHRAGPAEEVRDRITDAGGEALCVKADIGVENDIVALFEAADRFGPLWGLVNNAGIIEQDSRVDAMSADRLKKIFDTNAVGTFLCCREAVRRMSTQFGGEGGSIVNVSSMNSVYGGGGRAVDYGASKGAVDTLTIGLAREVAREGIRVNCVRPAGVRTDFLRLDENPGRLEAISENLPIGRIGEPIELAKAIVFLLSEDSSFTTGTILNVSGGR